MREVIKSSQRPTQPSHHKRATKHHVAGHLFGTETREQHRDIAKLPQRIPVTHSIALGRCRSALLDVRRARSSPKQQKRKIVNHRQSDAHTPRTTTKTTIPVANTGLCKWVKTIAVRTSDWPRASEQLKGECVLCGSRSSAYQSPVINIRSL